MARKRDEIMADLAALDKQREPLLAELAAGRFPGAQLPNDRRARHQTRLDQALAAENEKLKQRGTR